MVSQLFGKELGTGERRGRTGTLMSATTRSIRLMERIGSHRQQYSERVERARAVSHHKKGNSIQRDSVTAHLWAANW